MKANTVFEVISSQQVDGQVSADETIRLTSNAGSQYPEYLRRILYTTEEGKKLVFITSDFKRPAQALLICTKCVGKSSCFFQVDQAKSQNQTLSRYQQKCSADPSDCG